MALSDPPFLLEPQSPAEHQCKNYGGSAWLMIIYASTCMLHSAALAGTCGCDHLSGHLDRQGTCAPQLELQLRFAAVSPPNHFFNAREQKM